MPRPKFGGGALLYGGLIIKATENFGPTMFNELQQNSIMQDGYDRLGSLRGQYSIEEVNVAKFQKEYTDKGCDKL